MVQGDEENRRQAHVEGCRDADAIEPFIEFNIPMEMAAADFDPQRPPVTDKGVEEQVHRLAQARRPGRAFNPHGRNRSQAKNEDRVANDVDQAAQRQANHSNLHAANGLEHLFINQVDAEDRRKGEDDDGIAQA